MSRMKCCTSSYRFILPLASTLVLAACGGGGGGGDLPPPPPGTGTGGNPGGNPTAPVEPDTTLSTTPPSLSNSATASFAFSSDTAGATFEVSVDGGAFAAATTPHQVAGLNDGQHTFAVRAVASGTADATPATYTWTVDTTAPDTRLLNAPPSLTTQTTAAIEFDADEAGATFEASVDGGPFQAATSPLSLSAVALGNHSVRVRATDPAGNVETAVAEHNWTVVAATGDTTPPDTQLTSAPPASPTAQRAASFAFTSTEAGSVFEGSLNGEAFRPITSPFQLTNVPDGNNSFRIRAIDASGNVDLTPVSVSWTVDATPPDTVASSGPSGTVNSPSATIAFSATEAGASFEGRLDNQAFQSVTSPVQLSNLGQGARRYEVRAIDSLGNVDATPLVFNWTVDTQAPNTTLSASPPAVTKEKTASFTFSSNEAGATFELKLDDGAFAAATSPAVLNNLADGSHTVQIRARDAAGNVDMTPASHTWTIDGTVPQVAITFPTPVALTDASQVTVTGISSDAGGVATVTVNGQSAASSNNFATWSATVMLSAGNNTLTVAAQDVAGNSSTTTASLKVSPNLFTNPDRLALDSGGNRALVVDDVRILALDLASGARTVFADSMTGSGPALQRPRGIAVDNTNSRAIVADGQLRAIVAINLSTQARSILSDGATGSGPTIGTPQGLALDASGTTAYVADSSAAVRGILAVNLQTGARTVLSGTGVADGPAFSVPLDVALDSANNRLLVTDLFNTDRITAVDLSTGNRSILSDATTGTGTAIQTAWRIAVDPQASRALVVDSSLNAVVAISLSNAARSVFSDNSSSGPRLVEPRGILFDNQTSRALLAEAGTKTVVALNGATGARTRVSDDGIGAGPTFGFVEDLALDAANGRIIALQNDPYGLVSVDLGNSNRAAPLDNSTGGGPQIARAYRIAVDSSANRVIALAEDAAAAQPRGAGLFAVDLGPGARSILFNDFRTLNPNYGAPANSDLALENGRALVAVPAAIPDPTEPGVIINTLDVIVSVPLSGAGASELSGEGKGEQLSEGGSEGLAIDTANSRLLVMDAIARRLVAVNLSTGNRTTVSSGAPFQTPDGVAYDVRNQRPIVSDSGADTIFAIGNGGQKQVLSSNSRGRGPALTALRGIGVSAQTGVILLYDIGMSALMAVEPNSGDRVIVSR